MTRRYLGMAPIYEGETGLEADTDNLQRESELGYDDDEDELELGYYMDDEEDEDFQVSGRLSDWRAKRKRKRSTRKRRKAAKLEQRAEDIEDRGSRRSARREARSDDLVVTVLPGSGVSSAAASEEETVQLEIRPQHDFWADDVTFTGSVAGTSVSAIFFGEDRVFDSPTGVPVEFFAANNQLRGLLKGRFIKAGLDIRVVTSAPAGKVAVQFVGKKPA